MWDSYRLVGHAVQAWVYQGLYGLSGVGNIRGGVWVVLKLEWQPLRPRTPPTELRGGCSSSPPASSSPFTSLVLSFSPFLASAAVWRFSASRSAPSPSWPLRQPEGFLLRMYCRLEMYCKTWFGIKHYLCNAEHLLGAINKIVVFYFCALS